MPDVNVFIDQLGADISKASLPTVHSFIDKASQQIANSAGPQVGAFTDKLVKEITQVARPMLEKFVQDLVKQIVDQQSGPAQNLVTDLVKNLASRYHPELRGNLTARIVKDGIELESKDTRLDIKNRETGASITSLDIPVSVKIQLDEFSLNIEKTVVQIKNPHIP